MTLIKTARKDSWELHTPILYKGWKLCGSDIGRGSWSVSIPIQGLTVVYRQAEHRRGHRFCFMAIAWLLPSAIPLRWLKWTTMHHKPVCVQT